MVFISERIINISELEQLIEKAKISFGILERELKKDAPSKETIDSAIDLIRDSLEKAEKFEFCIEKRKCEIKAGSENPKSEENFSMQDNLG